MRQAETNRAVSRWLVTIGLLVSFCLGLSGAGMAQGADQASITTPSPTPMPTPIPASNIPTRATADADFARQAVANSAPDDRFQSIDKEFPGEQARIKELRETTEKQINKPGPASIVKESEKAWVREQARLDRWLTDLSERSKALDRTVDDIENRISLWQLTRDHQSADKLPPKLIQQISGAIKDLSSAETGVRSARDSILNLQVSIAKEKDNVVKMLANLQVEISKRTKGVFGIDSPPIWKAFGTGGEASDARQQFLTVRHEHWESLKNYVSEQKGQLLIWVLLWPALIMLMVMMHRKAVVWAEKDASLQMAVSVFSRPASSALVVTALLNMMLQPQAPSVWSDATGLLLLLAMWRVLPPLLSPSMRLAPYFVVLVFVLQRIVVMAPEGYFIYRIALLALSVGGGATGVWLIRALRSDCEGLSKKWHSAVLFAGQMALVLFGVGAVADISGSVELSSIVLMGTAQTMLAAVLMAVLSLTLRSTVRVALQTKWAHRIGFAPDHTGGVKATLFGMIRFLAIVAWATVSLRGFLLFDPLRSLIRRAFDWTVTIGDFSIDPGDFLIFGFTIWLSFKIAAFVQFILKVDFLPRVDLPRGVPETISRLTRYVVIAVGAVIASAAAGFDIGKVTIVIGALGVGIGFGLQNIVNNFVSGLILLFERPVRVGDTLNIADTGGVVEKIGMRASIVSTWDGAEVIVPNAHLISEDVTNWTLTHDRRRMVIPVCVAYGSDPKKTAQLIVDAATEHKSVDARPEPTCLFAGFGDSALEFELRAWAAGSDFLGVASDLRFAIVEKLDEAGIEIPFPQRDLHLRTSQTNDLSWAGVEQDQKEEKADD